MMQRRQFLTMAVKSAMAAGMTSAIPVGLLKTHTAHAAVLAAGLSDPAAQPLFVHEAPNALADAFKYQIRNDRLRIAMAQSTQFTGLVGTDGMTLVPTTVWGYGANDMIGVTWPGRTIERHVNDAPLEIKWQNKLVDDGGNPLPHLLPVDRSLHWAYSLHSPNGVDYRQYSLEANGVPVVPHVHGGRNDSPSDGNPEYFFSPDYAVRGPRWVDKKYIYGDAGWNDVAGMLWYHDHALGLTRLNVYAGLAGFFPLRDDNDSGKPGNPLGLPAGPYELGFAVQDRMFRNTGELFYPAFPGDPFYADFITDEGAELPEELFPGGGPTALAEFFGDHMVVNGIIWPKYRVEPRQYRVRLVNGTDSRFMRLKLKIVSSGETNPANGAELPFLVIGSDQSLRETPVEVIEIDFLPGERLDLIIDFNNVDVALGSRVIVENVLGDAPFGGELPDPDPEGGDVFPDRRTDRIMAFDIDLPLDNSVLPTSVAVLSNLGGGVNVPPTQTVRKLALFEGKDEFGRLQPLLGTAEPVEDVEGNLVSGSLTWFQPITENPVLGSTEVWEIYNATGDAHPVHVHLVHFEVLNRQAIQWDGATNEDDRVLDPGGPAPQGNGTYLVSQPTLQHNGTEGVGFRMENLAVAGPVRDPDPAERTRRDMVLALPGEVTRIRMTFDKPGRYVWHCHILSHEDHEMMRPFHVGEGPF